jgi:DNA-binding NarL/FixJ family response regulator
MAMIKGESVLNAELNKNAQIRILLADDHPLFCHALRDILEKQRDFQIMAVANDGEEAVALTEKLSPDVVIMDISMPKLNGLEATRQIKERFPQVYVLVLTVHTDSEHILGILQVGADGYLLKNVYSNEVIQAVRSLVAGETVLSPSVSRQIYKYAFQHVTKPLSLEVGERLSSREIEILRLTAIGIGNKEIASRLGLSLRTVKGYLTELFSKLNVVTRTEAVIVALRRGILTLDDLE